MAALLLPGHRNASWTDASPYFSKLNEFNRDEPQRRTCTFMLSTGCWIHGSSTVGMSVHMFIPRARLGATNELESSIPSSMGAPSKVHARFASKVHTHLRPRCTRVLAMCAASPAQKPTQNV